MLSVPLQKSGADYLPLSVQLRQKGLEWLRMMWYSNLRAQYMIGIVDEVK